MYSITVSTAATGSKIIASPATLQDALAVFEGTEIVAGETIAIRDTRTDSVLVVYREEFAHVTVAA